MSGRWRSRHWRSEGGEEPHELRDRSRERYRRHEDRWSSSHNEDGLRREQNRADGGGGSDVQDRWQQPRPRPGYKPSAHRSDSTDRSGEGGEWRRGQPLTKPPPPPDAANKERQTTEKDARSRPNSAVRARASFPPAPAKAWSNNNLGNDRSGSAGRLDRASEPSSSATQAKNHATIQRGKTGWAKPDSVTSSAEVSSMKQSKAWVNPAPLAKTSAGKPSTAMVPSAKAADASKLSEATNTVKRSRIINMKNSSPWGKPVSILTKPSSAGDNSAFPPMNAEGSDQRTRALDAAVPKETKSAADEPKLSGLPVTSSWGKSQIPAANGRAKVKIKKEKRSKVEEFPSLSTSSALPRSNQQQKHPLPSAKPVTPATDVKMTKNKKGPSKKSATPANLSLFLTPQISGGADANRGSKKKQHPSASIKGNSGLKAKAHAGMSMNVGMKRRAPSSAMNNAEGMLDFFCGGKGGVVKKGRQRVAPRKKKLTTLKKHVLKERLRVWKERNGLVDGENKDPSKVPCEEQGLTEDQPNAKRLKTGGTSIKAVAPLHVAKSTTLLLDNFIRLEDDDLTDEDEYDEITTNLISLAGRVGKATSVFVPRPRNSEEGHGDGGEAASLECKHLGWAFVRFGNHNDVCAAKDILEGVVVGGQQLRTSILDSDELVQVHDNVGMVAPSAENDRQWRLAALRALDMQQTQMDSSDLQAGLSSSDRVESTSPGVTIIFHSILCEDDYEDEEALLESTEDIKGLAQQYGPVQCVRASTSGDDKGNVYITFDNLEDADKAVQQLNGILVGGSKITVGTISSPPKEQKPSTKEKVLLTNVLNDDDFDDEDCLNETIEDIKNLAQKYGNIDDVKAETSGENKGNVHIYFEGNEVAQRAARELQGVVFGGLTINASVVSVAGTNGNDRGEKFLPSPNDKEADKSEPSPPPMFSGDKIIPEQFAACKRVPKIPNAGKPRAYATKIDNDQAVPLVIEMLGQLMRLQERSKDDKNARARRRLVMGLREVARGIRAHKVKMVVMANNLDDYGAIDAKLQEILDLARNEDLPVLFELNKRKLGKALGKSIKVSVVGIQNADGAHEQFKKLKKMMGMA
ncbi:hypothetical protein ACHAWF_006010 [Thalassiosira exigua]